ncbi:MAG TPA: 1-acyl-sn-glycerol-3-phosphate acyltransferase [Bacteroidales bacterium]|nr:1-acyl-sn-glycerol-3-phosphate acyltransferase [Bacteroidales bacterium]
MASESNKIGTIDVDNVLRSKNPSLARIVPRFLINYLKRVIHQDEINVFLTKSGHLRDAELLAEFLRHFGVNYTVHGQENIPASGRFIFVSNHPLGGLDGIVFTVELSKRFTDVKFPVNDILLYIGNLSGVFLPVNKHGNQGRDAARKIEEAYASGSQILYFPAGLCSRKKKGIIRDLEWQKSFIVKAVQHRRDVIPCYFSGRNSNFFYNLANFRKSVGLKANIEMLYLPDEMFKQKGIELHMVFGKPIPWSSFDKSRTPVEWADHVKNETYKLKSSIPDSES